MLFVTRSTCLSFIEAIAPSRAPVSNVKSDNGAIAPFYLGTARHRINNVFYLFHRRKLLFSTGSSNPHVFVRDVEVFAVGIANAGFVPWLCSKPLKESLDLHKRRLQGGLT